MIPLDASLSRGENTAAPLKQGERAVRSRSRSEDFRGEFAAASCLDAKPLTAPQKSALKIGCE
jgi:hypothetical protein